MLKNPFGPTQIEAGPVASAAPRGMGGEGVEVRYSPASRTLVPGALLLSGILVPSVLFFVLPSPFNITMSVVTAVVELGTAAFMWFLFNAALVRADDSGVTKKQLGKSQTIAWSQISSVEFTEKTAPAQTVYELKDAFGKTLLEFNDFGNKRDGVKLRAFIEARLGKR